MCKECHIFCVEMELPVARAGCHVAYLVDGGAVDGGAIGQQTRVDEQQDGGDQAT